MRRISVMRACWLVLAMAACGGGDDDAPQPLDPDTAPTPVIDRFSSETAVLLVRDAMPALPAAGAPIDFDQAPFLVHGLGPGGEHVTYYHLDAHREAPINIYRLYYEGQAEPIADQLPIVDYIPGQHGYSDFWRVIRVDVPADYVPNTATSNADINVHGWPFTATDMIVNCPVVPLGSTATLRRGTAGNELHRGWYKNQVVYYFTFEEAPLFVVDSKIPVSTAYATFNVNGSWPSGFMTETGSDRTHVVADALSGTGYSSLRAVRVYDNASFASVVDLASAQAAPVISAPAVLWNAPLVVIDP
jgi:hypothetical protein